MTPATRSTSSRDTASRGDLRIITGSGGVPIVDASAPTSIRASVDWLRERHGELRRALHRHGFLMLRGMPVTTPADVAAVRDAVFAERALNRERTAQRTDLGDEIYSANDLPPAHRIGFHNENSYALEFPGVLLFACLEPPTSGGCTVVADGRLALQRLPAAIADRYRATGWLLTRHYHPGVGQSIESAFESTDPATIAAHCERNLIAPRWLDGGVLRTVQRRTATVRHPVTGEECLFGHMSFWSRWSLAPEVRQILVATYGDGGLPFDTGYGDGHPIPEADMAALNDTYVRGACREPWQRGDVLLVDNLLASHGRDAFRGKRRVVVAMGELLTVDACRPGVAAAASPL